MKKTLLLLSILLTAASCNLPEHYFSPKPECVDNEMFSNIGDSGTEKYQAQVKDYLKDKKSDQFRYFFKTFIEEENKSYMMTNFRNEQACFDVKILVENWDKLEGMKKVDGQSYPEELYNLKWELRKIDGAEEVIYQDMHKIID